MDRFNIVVEVPSHLLNLNGAWIVAFKPHARFMNLIPDDKYGLNAPKLQRM
jgi:hypothetical protein